VIYVNRIRFPRYLLSDAGNEVQVRLMPNLRLLRLVIQRKPIPFMPYPKNPQYLLAYCTELLECGHQVDFFPQADPLIARRRSCPDCAALPQKKPVQSVRSAARKGAA
jgi:hypothetical protein